MEQDFVANLLAAQQQEPKRRKKRGGLAGIWDRNKKIIAPVVGAGLGVLTGGVAAPAIAGGLMRGLDRPGKRGIGLDVGQAARGAVEGAASGAAGRGLGAIAQGARMGAAGARGLGMSQIGGAARGAGLAARDVLGGAMPATGGAATGGAGAAPARGLARALQFIEQNPQAAGMGLQALSGIMESQSERRIRERQEAEERRRAQNLAMLALPMYDPMMGRR